LARPSTLLSSSNNTSAGSGEGSSNHSNRRNSGIFHHKRNNSSTSSSSQILRPVLGKLISSFSGLSLAKVASSPPPPQLPASASASAQAQLQAQAPAHLAVPATLASTGVLTPPAYDDVSQDSSSHFLQQAHHPPRPRLTAHHLPFYPHHSDNMAVASNVAIPSTAYNTTSHRNSLMSVRSAKSAVSSLVTEVPKPVASGSGVSCSILLAERNVFLTGFDHNGHGSREGQSGTSLLRGKLQLNVTKNVKIKAVQLKLLGRARTEWPEGIPPQKKLAYEEEGLRTQVLTFFNALHDDWEGEYGNQCTYKLKNGSANSSSTNLSLPQRPGNLFTSASSRSGLTAKELKKLSLQHVQSRSFGKGEYGVATTTQAKDFKVFYPGTYDYSFELPIDHHQLETTKLPYGSVKWELHATLYRGGAFKSDLQGSKEVSIVRLPDHMSLEMTEPISISRRWEDQLHYDIVISGKSFPIGSKIPIAFKLTPLAKVQVHTLKVYVTESMEYFTNDQRVTRKDAGRKLLILEKSAGKPLDRSWAASDVITVRGGELEAEERREARAIASLRRAREAARHGRAAEPLPEPANNLLGDIDLGLEHIWGSTEIEANVQLPTCQMMAKNKALKLHPDCSWKNVNVYHWIKVVLRLSRADPDDPSGKKRRHFEISIDSPLTILDCRATQANTNLPAYAGPNSNPTPHLSSCGCADAPLVPCDYSPNSSTGTLPGTDLSNEAGFPLPPQAAHLAHSAGNTRAHHGSPMRSPNNLRSRNEPRPMHFMRTPSFNPPAFDDDTAPPPLVVGEITNTAAAPCMTPPPQYDMVVGTPSVDGMADYFTRLADAGFMDEDENDSASDDSDEQPARILDRSGRVKNA
jgi:hypothetical protein